MKSYFPFLVSALLLTSFSLEIVAQNLLASPHFLEARKKANEEDKRLLVHFTASWSNPCSKMFSTTYRDEEIRDLLINKFVFTLIDIDDFDGYVLGQHYHINNLPTLVLFDQNGRILKRHQGKLSAEELKEFLDSEVKAGEESLAKPSDATKPGMLERINNTPVKSSDELAKNEAVNENRVQQDNSTTENLSESYYAIQLGAFTDKNNAEKMLHSYSAYAIGDLHLQSELLNDRERYILLGGKFKSREQAEQKLAELRNNGKDGFIKTFNNSNG
jgi:thioredoxin-related protein